MLVLLGLPLYIVDRASYKKNICSVLQHSSGGIVYIYIGRYHPLYIYIPLERVVYPVDRMVMPFVLLKYATLYVEDRESIDLKND